MICDNANRYKVYLHCSEMGPDNSKKTVATKMPPPAPVTLEQRISKTPVRTSTSISGRKLALPDRKIIHPLKKSLTSTSPTESSQRFIDLTASEMENSFKQDVDFTNEETYSCADGILVQSEDSKEESDFSKRLRLYQANRNQSEHVNFKKVSSTPEKSQFKISPTKRTSQIVVSRVSKIRNVNENELFNEDESLPPVWDKHFNPCTENDENNCQSFGTKIKDAEKSPLKEAVQVKPLGFGTKKQDAEKSPHKEAVQVQPLGDIHNKKHFSPQKERRNLTYEDVAALQGPLITNLPRQSFQIDTSDAGFLGKGGFGTVWKGKLSTTDIAIKKIPTEGEEPYIVTREAIIQKKLSHPNIVMIMGLHWDKFNVYILMERVDGHSLSNVLYKESVHDIYNLSVTDKNRIGKQICTAIDFLHVHPDKIIHRDIKPANVLVSYSNIAKICDLGLARSQVIHTQLESTKAKVLSAPGTLHYMAPELVLFVKDATRSTDIYALACTLWEMYQEKKPFRLVERDTKAELIRMMYQGKFPDMSGDIIPEFLKPLIKRCFNLNPDYESVLRPHASEFVEAYQNNI